MMTVKELIEELSKLDGEKEVEMYGYEMSDVGSNHVEIDRVKDIGDKILLW